MAGYPPFSVDLHQIDLVRAVLNGDVGDLVDIELAQHFLAHGAGAGPVTTGALVPQEQSQAAQEDDHH